MLKEIIIKAGKIFLKLNLMIIMLIGLFYLHLYELNPIYPPIRKWILFTFFYFLLFLENI